MKRKLPFSALMAGFRSHQQLKEKTSFFSANRIKKWSALTTFIASSAMAISQTVLVNPLLEGGFELGASFAANGWSVDNGTAVNQWNVGTVPSGFTNNSAYISSDAGATNGYTNSSASVVHFYRDVVFPAGETAIALSFNWKGQGEAGFWDALIVSIAPTTYTPAASTTSIGTSNLGAPTVELGRFWATSTTQSATISIPASVAGNCSSSSTMRLIFTWKNDGSGGSAPSAAVDDIALISSLTPITAAGGTFTIDNTQPQTATNFPNFTSAIVALNAAYSCAPFTNPVVFNVSAGQTFNELPPVITASGSSTASITFQKSGAGANPVITSTGTTSTADGSIVVSGGDYFVFDGIDLTNTASLAMEYGYVLRNISATDGAKNNIVQNCVIQLSRAVTTAASSGILVSATTTGGGITPTSAAGSNDNNQFLNITVNGSINGVSFLGNATYPDLTNSFTSTAGNRNTVTNIGPVGPTFVVARGIYASNQSGVTIANSDISAVTSNQATAQGVYITGNQGNSVVSANTIYGISNQGSASGTSVAYGIQAQNNTSGTHNVRIVNNMIANIFTAFTGTATSNRYAIGIHVGVASAAATQSFDVYHNSVSIGEGLTPTYSNSCFEIQNVASVYRVQNNIFANFTNTQAGAARHYTWVTTSATNIGASGSISNRNDLFVANDLGTTGFTARANTNNIVTLVNWTAAITAVAGTDQNSANINPMFVNNTTNLHLNLGVAATQIESGGATLGVTVDFDGQVRPGPTGSVNGGATAPDMGADEFDGVPAAPPAITFNSITPAATPQCVATARLISVDLSNTSGSITTVNLLHSINGSAQTPIAMTNTSGSTWQGTIPVPAPVNAIITWSVEASNSVPLTSTYIGSSYTDEPLTGYTATASASVSTICPASATDLTATFLNLAAEPSYTAPPAVSSPTTDEDLGNVTITKGAATVLNNTTARNSLAGTIGTAAGTAGSYSNFTAFGPYELNVGDVYDFSVSTLQSTSAYNNGIGIWIDYNRNGVFTDAGEAVYTSATLTSGAHTETGSFTVPATASPGLTRMRVLVNEGSITGPTQSVSWGEYEEYAINLTPDFTVSWSDGVGTVGTSNPSTVTPSVTTTYTATITSGGCVFGTTPSTTVTVTPVVVALTPVDATCNGGSDGSFTLGTITCGTAPFEYAVDGGAFGPIPVNLPAATYSVVVRDATMGTSSPISVVVGQSPVIIANPVGTNATACIGDASATVSATSDLNTTTAGSISASFGTNLISTGAGSVFNVNVPAIPANATITGTTLLITGATANSPSYRSEIRVELSGATTLAATQISTDASAGLITPNPNITIPNLPAAGGAVTLTITETYDDSGDDATFGEVQIIVNYTTPNPATISWWDAASGGNNLGASASLETVGTATLPNTSVAGTYTFYAQGQNGICTSASRTAVTVTVNTLPIVGAGTDQTACQGSPVTLSGSGATSYAWDNGVTDGVAFNTTVTATYTVTGTDGNGCQNTDQVVVNVNALPTVNAGTDVAVCDGASATLTASGTATGYAWDNSVTDGVAFTPVTTTTYTVTGTDGNGCQNTDQVTVTVNALPVVDAGIDQTTCEGSMVTLSGSGATSYAWDNSVTDGVAFAATVTTTYTVTGTDGNGCQNTDQIAVTVNTLPVVGAGTDQTVCEGTDVTLSGSGTTSYAWDNGVTDGVAFAATVTTTYTVTGTDANGCQNTDQVTVTVNAAPVVDAGVDMAVCDGGDVTLTASGTATGYTWDNSVTDGVAFTPAVTTTFTVTGTDGNGCENTDQVTVTVNTLPVVDAGVDMDACDGSDVTLFGSGASTYAWDNGVTDGVAFAATATTTYTVTGTDANGCENTDQVTVTVNTLPVVNAGADQTVCEGTDVTLSGSGATSYAWDNGVTDGVAFAATATTTYTVTGTDANGCENTDQVIVNVNAVPNAVATDNGDATITASAGASYQWVHCATGLPIAGATAQTYTATVNGNYAVVVTNASGCSDTSNCITIDNIGIGELADASIRVFPNPTNGDVFITMSAENAAIEVLDAQGKLLQGMTVANGEKVQLSAYETGVYFLRIRTENGQAIERIVKN